MISSLAMNSSNVVEIDYDSDRDAYRATFDPDEEHPCIALVEAISAIEETDSTEMKPLGSAVDAAALDDAFRSLGVDFDVRITLTYHGYRATVRDDGRIDLRPVDSDADRADATE